MNHYKHEIKQVSELLAYKNNSRTHSEEQIQQICDSINEFGFTNPVLIDENNQIIAGHCRVIAATRINITEVPCIVLSGLTDEQKKAYVIADNQLALNAGWDIDTLKSELLFLNESEFDVTLIGLDSNYLESILIDEHFDEAEESDQGRLDELEPKYTQCPHCGKEYDLRSV